MTSQLTEEESGTIVIVQNLHPDRSFQESSGSGFGFLCLVGARRVTPETNFAPDEQSELATLVEAEERAASKRAEAILRDTGE